MSFEGRSKSWDKNYHHITLSHEDIVAESAKNSVFLGTCPEMRFFSRKYLDLGVDFWRKIIKNFFSLIFSIIQDMSSNSIPETFRTFLTRQSPNFECSCHNTDWVDLIQFETQRSHFFLVPEMNSWTLTLWVSLCLAYDPASVCVCAFERLLSIETFWNLSYARLMGLRPL